MNEKTKQSSHVEKVLKEQAKTIHELESEIEKVRKRLMWLTISGWVRTLFIVIPIILGILFISPYVREAFDYFTLGQGAALIESVGKISEFVNTK